MQTGLDAWLAGPGRRHRLVVGGGRGDGDLGGISTAARPAGPGRLARRCVTRGTYLVEDDGGRLTLLLQGPAEGGPAEPVTSR